MTRSIKAPKYTNQVEVPTTRLYLPQVVSTTNCVQHDAGFNEPCFLFEAAEASTIHTGICNSRAKAAGMNGAIHPSSLDGRPQQSRRQYA